MRVEMLDIAGYPRKETTHQQFLLIRHNLQQSVMISDHFRNSGSFRATTQTMVRVPVRLTTPPGSFVTLFASSSLIPPQKLPPPTTCVTVDARLT
jgi:hypothetical protein